MNWRWLLENVVIAVHDEQIAIHGGMQGLLDHGLLVSAMMRPQNKAVYGEPSVFELATAYSSGIIKNHPFMDGNKRTGFLAAYIFLALNGWQLAAPEPEAVTAVLSLATGNMDEQEFSQWLMARSIRLDPH